MRSNVVLMAVLLVVAAAAASPALSGTMDPCRHHECRRGEQCVVHEVRCAAPPCPRIGECRPERCALACPAGRECRLQPQPCLRQPCPLVEQCLPEADACEGRCLADELCLSRVRPCLAPPCPVESVCVPPHAALTARRQPPPPPFCEDCPLPGVCVATPICRQVGDCLYLPVCVTNCSSMWCGLGHACEMRPPAQCEQASCAPQPTCVPGPGAAPLDELGSRFGAGSRPAEPPRCIVPCARDEECRVAPPRSCRSPPCRPLASCRPRGSSGPGGPSAAAQVAPAPAAPPSAAGDCPLDDLRQLGSSVFCDQRLDQCAADAECGERRRCCPRGCGTTCLPVCRPGCGAATECRLVEVQCIGSPCPKVAQCVAAEPASAADQFAPAAGASSSASSAARPAAADARPAPAAPARPPRPAAPGAFLPPPPPPQRPESGFGGGFGGGGGAASFDPVRPTRRPAPPKPGACPANDRSRQSIICFDNGSVDQCLDDSDCQGAARCCLNGCQRQCRTPCARGCGAGQMCMGRPGSSRPVCRRVPTPPTRPARRPSTRAARPPGTPGA